MGIGTLRRLLRSPIVLYISCGLLALVTLYCAWYANYYLSGNSDDLIYPYLFQHFQLHNIVLPGQHANILKFPIFILQAFLPYTFTTFSIVSIGLVLVTILGWAALLVWLFGKRYAPLICVTLAAVLLGSQMLNYDLLGTTIRNIEYPIMLAFIIYAGRSLQLKTLSRFEWIWGGIIGILFALTMAGDSFFLYTICLSLLVTLAVLWFQDGGVNLRTKRPFFKHTFYYVAGFSLLALFIREVVKVLGIAQYYTAAVFNPHILPLNHLAPSLATATTQVLVLFGANIFGQQVTLGNIVVFVNFLVLIVGLGGLIVMAWEGLSRPRRVLLGGRIDYARIFIYSVVALTAFVTYGAYVAADLVVQQDTNGHVTSFNQERYLAIVPLLLVMGVVYVVWRRFALRRIVAWGLPLTIAVALLIGLPHIRSTHTNDGALRNGPIAVAKVAQAHHIPLLITGYWYGAATRFWSHNTIQFASVAGCNVYQPTFNTRLSWYVPATTAPTDALVVVHKGPDSSYWTCPDATLRKIYGTPSQIIKVKTPDQPELWVYHYDLRIKILPINY